MWELREKYRNVIKAHKSKSGIKTKGYFKTKLKSYAEH